VSRPAVWIFATTRVKAYRACELCVHGIAKADRRHCACPAAQEEAGPPTVQQARAEGASCGPGAFHLDMRAWH
jgi:hypothetical protein